MLRIFHRILRRAVPPRSAPALKPVDWSNTDWAAPVLSDVENWKDVDPDLLPEVYHRFHDKLYEPIEAIEKRQEELLIEGERLATLITERAPDLVDRALKAHPLRTGIFIPRETEGRS